MAGCRWPRTAASEMRNTKAPALSDGQLRRRPTGWNGSARPERRPLPLSAASARFAMDSGRLFVSIHVRDTDSGHSTAEWMSAAQTVPVIGLQSSNDK